MKTSGQNGQASVELLAVIPLVLLVLLGAWQIALGGHTWWKLREVARVGARAQYVAELRGEPEQGLKKARRTAAALLGETPAASRRVKLTRDGAVVVSARIPLVDPLRAVIGSERAPRLTAKSRMSP
jgi:hypothetical protein